MTEKNLYTLAETANELSLSLSTIRRWSATGRLPTIRFSKRTVRVSRSVIEDVLTHGLPGQAVQEVKNA